MIEIYTEKANSKDWILQNDLYFNLNTGNEESFLLWIILRFICQDQRFLIFRMMPKSDLMILI